MLVLVYFGGIWTALLTAALAAIAMNEYCKMFMNMFFKIPRNSLVIFAIILSVSAAYLKPHIWLLLIFFMIMSFTVWAMFRQIEWEKLSVIVGGVIYISFGFGLFLALRLDYESFYYILFAFLISWATDSGAYIIGCSFGKKKLAPTISPNKTVEGMIGGIVFALAIAGTFGAVVHLASLSHILIITILASFIGQVGDLFESYLKRYFQTKDSGSILPGHGGILDRFDSILTIAPLLYLLFYLVK